MLLMALATIILLLILPNGNLYGQILMLDQRIKVKNQKTLFIKRENLIVLANVVRGMVQYTYGR